MYLQYHTMWTHRPYFNTLRATGLHKTAEITKPAGCPAGSDY